MTQYRPSKGLGPVTKNLLIINCLMLIITYVGAQTGIDIVDHLGLHFFESTSFHFFQLITYMFLHGGIMHLFSNMFGLFIFGKILEQFWGSKRFLIFYMACGLGAAMAQEAVWYFQLPHDLAPQLANLYNTIGASGSIFGILVAFGMLFPNTELMLLFFPIPIKAKYFVIIYCLFELTSGVANFSGDNVAHYAHLGGAIVGFIIVRYWQKQRNTFY